MKKTLSFLLVTMLITLTVLTACGEGGENSGASSLSEVGASGADDGGGQTSDKKITVMVESGSMGEAVAIATADEFKELTGYEVVIDPVPYTGMYDKLSTGIRAGASTHDVAHLDPNWIGGLSEGLLPLNDLLTNEIEGDLVPGLIDAFSLGDNLYGMPMWTNCTVLIYRKDWFDDEANKAAFKDKYGYDLKAPQTWDEFKNCAEFFTTDDTYGCAIVGKPGDASVDRWMDAARQAGASAVVFNEAGQCVVGERAYVDAAIFMRDLYLNGFAPEETLTIADAESQELFKGNKIAMQFEWTHQYADAVQSMGVEKVGVAPNIAGAGGIGSFTAPFCESVLSTSPNQEIAKQYIQFKYERNALYMEASLRVAARASVLEEYADKEGYEHIDAMFTTLNGPMVANRSARYTNWKQYEEVLSAALQSIFAGADPDTTIAAASEEIASIGI